MVRSCNKITLAEPGKNVEDENGWKICRLTSSGLTHIAGKIILLRRNRLRPHQGGIINGRSSKNNLSTKVFGVIENAVASVSRFFYHIE